MVVNLVGPDACTFEKFNVHIKCGHRGTLQQHASRVKEMVKGQMSHCKKVNNGNREGS